MLPGLNLPASLLCLLGELRPCFTAPGFATFCGLVAGLAGQVRRRTVVGMLLGGGLQHAWPHDRAHYFFARARWELDQLGLAVAQLAVMLLVPPGADLGWPSMTRCSAAAAARCTGLAGSTTAAPRRRASSATASASSPPGSWSSCRFAPARCACRCWPACTCLARANGPGKVEMAAALVSLLALAFPGRMVHVVADAAYHGPALRTLPGNVTWTCRIPRNAVLYDLAPPRTGRRGRPRTKGDRLGTADDIAAAAAWATVTVTAYGRRAGQARRRGHLPVVRVLAHPHRAPDPGPRRAHRQRL